MNRLDRGWHLKHKMLLGNRILGIRDKSKMFYLKILLCGVQRPSENAADAAAPSNDTGSPLSYLTCVSFNINAWPLCKMLALVEHGVTCKDKLYSYILLERQITNCKRGEDRNLTTSKEVPVCSFPLLAYFSQVLYWISHCFPLSKGLYQWQRRQGQWTFYIHELVPI